MALDIHTLEKGQPAALLLSLDEAALIALAPAFARYKQATGLAIDPYGTLKLSSGLGPLLSALKATTPPSKQQAAIYSQVLHVLEAAEGNGKAVVFVGD